eukprot:gene14270-15781_t
MVLTTEYMFGTIYLLEFFLFGFILLLFLQHVIQIITNFFKVNNDPFRNEIIWNALKVCVASYRDPIEKAEIFKESSIKCYTSTPTGHSGQKYTVAFSDDYVMVGFMGTNNSTGWLTILNIFPVNAFDGQIHRDVYKRAESIPLDEILLLAKGRKLYFVGHSLGGSVAQVCTLLCLQRTSDENILKNIFCITFGSPYIGTKPVQEFVAAKRGSICLADHILTIFNENDFAPGALNIGPTVSKSTAIFKQYSQIFDHFLKFLPSSYATPFSSAIKFILKCLNFFNTNVQLSEYQPLGSYRFLELSKIPGSDQKELKFSKYYKVKDYKTFTNKDIPLNAANFDHHSLWRYEHNLSLILKVDSLRSNVFQLPHLNDMLSVLKNYKRLNNPYQLYIQEAIASITCEDTTLVIHASSKSEFKKITQILFKLNIRRVICCVSRHSFLIETFLSQIPKNFKYNQLSFKQELSSPISDYKHVIPVSDEAKEILNEEFINCLTFSSVFQHKFPNDKESPFLSINEIEERLKSKLMKGENILPFKGAIVVISGRIEKAEVVRNKFLRRFITLYRLKKEFRENAVRASRPLMSITQIPEVIARKVVEDISSLKSHMMQYLHHYLKTTTNVI